MPGLAALPRPVTGLLLLLFFLLFSLHGARSRPAEALANCDVGDLSIDAEERAFLQVINNHRARYGLNALSISENLTRSATWMATDLAAKNYFSHTDSLGRFSRYRIADCGGSLASGENLGAGPRIISAQQAFDLWVTSPGHNENMLYAGYRQIGIARVNRPGSYYTYYWVTTFDVYDDGTRLAEAGPTTTFGGGNLVDPPPGERLASLARVFSWTKPQGVYESWLDVGSCPGCNDLYSSSAGIGTNALVTDLPRDGRGLYVRLSLRTAKGWEYQDYVYTAASFQ